MPLAPGTRIGPYEIATKVGEGGMGEVYRARDTKLNREVAIKILPDAFASDPDRLARFTREAQTLAALNHSNIAQIYGLETQAGQAGPVEAVALVMELVEGDDLAVRVAKGPIPVEEALAIAKQIAAALETAHEHGIVHRDLKPANIKVRPDGTVKVLDFGLAKADSIVSDQRSGYNPSISPTLTSPALMTGVGMILGTAAYMAPEQARGRGADRRADIWAFGCVLFEMLSGRRAYDGEDVTDVLGAVVHLEPKWDALPPAVPPRVVQVIRLCLRKDPKQRAQAIGDVRLALDGAFESGASTPAAAAVAPAPPLWRRAVPAIVAAAAMGVVVGTAAWKLRPASPSPQAIRFTMPLPDQQITATNSQALAWSPDGGALVYMANRQLMLRPIADTAAHPITGTLETNAPTNVAFSPDGQWIAFVSTSDRAIKKIAVSGGASVTLCSTAGSAGRLTWDESGILFSTFGGTHGTSGIYRVTASGGEPKMLIAAKDDEMLWGPQMLPGGEWVLFTSGAGLVTSATADTWDTAKIVAQSLKSGERRTLVSGGSDARYVPSGHILYAVRGLVFAVPFDRMHLAVTGGPVPVVQGVRRSLQTNPAPVTQFDVSASGSLAFLPGPVALASNKIAIAIFDRKGTIETLNVPPGPYIFTRMSPDGRRIAFESDDGADTAIWIYEMSGASSARRLTLQGQGQGHNALPVWSPDSQRVAFVSDREGDKAIFVQRADGSSAAERLTKPGEGESHAPESWSPDGQHLLYNVQKGQMTSLWVLTLANKAAEPFDGVVSPAETLTGAVFSPDGRWVAYASREGRNTSIVYVQPFPATGAKYQISRDNEDGHHPLWLPDGSELMYTPGPGRPWSSVRVTTHPSFTFSEPSDVPRFAVSRNGASPATERPYDVTRDGQHFVGLVDAGNSEGSLIDAQIEVTINWLEELKKQARGK